MTKSEELRTRLTKAAKDALDKKGFANRQCECALSVPTIRALEFMEMTVPSERPAPLRAYVFVHCDQCGAGLLYDAVKLIGKENFKLAVGGFDDVAFTLN